MKKNYLEWNNVRDEGEHALVNSAPHGVYRNNGEQTYGVGLPCVLQIAHLSLKNGLCGKVTCRSSFVLRFGTLERQGKVSDLPEAQKKKSRLSVFTHMHEFRV